MKFIHAGDIHLGNPFLGLRNLPNWVQNIVQDAGNTAFRRLIADAIAEQVDFVLLPGDLFNSNEVDAQIELTVLKAFDELRAASIPVFLSFGNHDYLASKRADFPWPSNVHLFDESVTTMQLTTKAGESVAISGFSYGQQHIETAMIDQFPVKQTGSKYHLGMYHGELGRAGSGNYAPFALTALNEKHYDYWALGHIHLRQTLQMEPFIGYSGNLQGLNKNESGDKGYYLVTDQNGQLIPTFVAVAPIIWTEEELEIPMNLATNELVAYIRKSIQGDSENFSLINLRIISDDARVLSLIANGQLQAQLAQSSQTRDPWYIWQISLKELQKTVQLPHLPADAWDNNITEIFTLDNMQAAGLKQVHDPELLDEFLNDEKLTEIMDMVKVKLQLLGKDVSSDEN